MKITKIDVFHVKDKENPSVHPILCRVYTDQGIYGDGEAAMKLPMIFAMVMALEIKVADAKDCRLKYFIICGVSVLPATQFTAKNAYVKNITVSISTALAEDTFFSCSCTNTSPLACIHLHTSSSFNFVCFGQSIF